MRDDNSVNYTGIDIAKFLCSILVVTIHVPLWGYEHFENNYIGAFIARLAVPFFFITSSYFLFCKVNSGTKWGNSVIRNYLKRILNLYIIWTFVYLPISVVQLKTIMGGINTYTIMDYIRRCLFVGSFVHLWYMVALITSISIFAVVMKTIKYDMMIYVICALLYVVGLTGQGWNINIADVCPYITFCIDVYDKIFETTRNGILEAPIFIAMGYYFSKHESNKTNVDHLLFICFLLIMFYEFVFLTNDFVNVSDYCMSLVPASFLLFKIAKNSSFVITKQNSILFRKMSSLIFFLHYWIAFIVHNVFKYVYEDVTHTCFWFILTLVLSITCAYLIVCISNKIKLLRYFY